MNDLTHRDDGAIVVSTLFASAFLIGVLWYVLGLGDALLFHERMQDGADAVAFAPAVIDARGMNLIALINITMASILSVLVAVKIMQTLLLAANAAACAIRWNPDCPLLTSHEAPFAEFVLRTDLSVRSANQDLHDAAVAIARTMPAMGARRGQDAGRAFAPMAEGAFVASPSEITGDVEGSTRHGLPVEDDDFDRLCNHSGTLMDIVFVPTYVSYAGASTMVPTTLKYVAAMVPGLVRANPNAFCGGSGPVSLRLFDGAPIGGDYFATWGVTHSRFIEEARRGEDGSAIATWGKKTDARTSTSLDVALRETQIAKAEFYFDPRGAGPRGGQGLRDEALWHLRWRARLRAVRAPSRSLAALFAGSGRGPMERANGTAADLAVITASPESLAAWTEKNVGPVAATRATGGMIH